MFTEDQKKVIFPAVIILTMGLFVGYAFLPGILAKFKKVQESLPKNSVVENLITPNIMKLTSPAFTNNEKIPDPYTCKGWNVSPPLSIDQIPAGTKSLVLIVDDPDAPVKTWTHWVVFNIDPAVKTIGENSVPNGGVLGQNDFGRGDYGGPCPPFGTHRYFFRVYALDKMLGLTTGVTRAQVEKAITGHVLDKAELIGVFSK